MIELEKEHDFLICIDSDGTVMDTMILKHKNALVPSFIETFNITKYKDEILEEWIKLNCFSLKRGFNRFITVDIMLERIKDYGYEYYGLEEYHKWVNETLSLSIPSLEEKINSVSNSNCLIMVKNWAKRCNEKIANLPDAESFENAIRVILKLKDADLIGISTANEVALTKEWKSIGIYDSFKLVASQEYGTKEHVIKEALKKGYSKDKTIMIGDSFADINAAQTSGIWVFPIIPGHENESWEEFYTKIYPDFINGKFNKEYQDRLLNKFNSFLN